MARVQTAKTVVHTTSKLAQKASKVKPENSKKIEKSKPNPETKGKSPERYHVSLRDDIAALGGDGEDYKLLKDVPTDEEVVANGSNQTDTTLSKDLKKFIKNLNFSSVLLDDLIEEPNAEESEEGNEDEESEAGVLSETGSEARAQVTENKEGKQNVTVPKVGPNSRLLLEPIPRWYTLLQPLPPAKIPSGTPSQQTLSSKQAHASSLHSTEVAAYEAVTSANKLTASSSDAAFLQKILTSGTLSDRLSALTLMTQSSPVHNVRALETLRGMAGKKGREESLKALRAIVDWWVGGGAPDRKLKYFIDQPLTHPGATDRYLLMWYFEDWLKKHFFSILQILETLSLDPLPYVRIQAMTLIFTLLRDKPEQEQNLLLLLANKLGDSERSVASRASYHLLQLLQTHPSMKAVVVREISSLVLKPTRSASGATTTKIASGATHLKFTDSDSKPHAAKLTGRVQDKSEKRDLQQEHSRYYAAITLNQVMLSPSEADRAVARQLIGLYFELFKEILGMPGKPIDTMSAASEDVDHSRYGREKRKKLEEKMGKGRGKSDRAREGFAEVEDSNSKLVSAILTGVNRALPFAKMSLGDVEFSKHIDTLFLISHKSTLNISLQALRLIMQICISLAPTSSASTSSTLSMSITDRYYRSLYASLQDTRLNTSSKHAMYLNLLLKSLKMDAKPERVKAFVRRFLQLLAGAGPGGVEFIVGGLYLLGELFKTQPSLRDLLSRQKHSASAKDALVYDAKKRDPQYANAGASSMWELTPLLSHYHPTVRLHASQLLSGVEPTATADLSLNTLSHFLDRFVYKNPKKLKSKGPSAMQPGAAVNAQDDTSIRIVRGAQNGNDMVNDESFWKKDIKDVPVDQIFFHKYFSRKNEKERARAEKVSKRKGAVEVEGSEDVVEDEAENKVASKSGESSDEEESEGEAEVWKAIQSTNPDLNPDADADADAFSDETDSDNEEDSSEGGSEKSEEAADSDASDAAGDHDHERAGDEEEDEDDDEALSLAEASDADDLISLDNVQLPEGLISYDASSDDEGTGASPSGSEKNDERGGFGVRSLKNQKSIKRKLQSRKDEHRRRRRKLWSLPTFATYEDYAKLIEAEPEDNV